MTSRDWWRSKGPGLGSSDVFPLIFFQVFFLMFFLYVLVGWPRPVGQMVPRLQWSQERDALEAQNGSANIPNVCWFRCHLWATIGLAKVYNWWFTQCSNPDILVLTIRFSIYIYIQLWFNVDIYICYIIIDYYIVNIVNYYIVNIVIN